MSEVTVNVDNMVAAAMETLEAGNGAGGDGGVASGAPALPMPVPEGAVPEIKILIESPGASSSGTKNDSMVLCKICHDEGPEGKIEMPCACDGSIKTTLNVFQISHFSLHIMECMPVEYRPEYSVHPKSGLNDWFGNATPENYGEIINRGVRFLNTIGIIMMVLFILRCIIMLAVDAGGILDSSWYINVSEEKMPDVYDEVY